MRIQIESLSANGLGPIASIKWQFKDVNLIYGRNEQGKTFLVEYLLRSLFRYAPETRSLTDSGQVNITGLSSQISRFEPKSRKKLEDYLFQADIQKPVDLSRLCVVKGGELSFLSGGEQSISKNVLKDYLSDQRILDSILKDIKPTVQESTWENGQIIGKKHTGQIRDLSNEISGLKQIDDLLEEIDQAFSLGEIKKQKNDLQVLGNLITEQLIARRVYAYSLSQQIKGIEENIRNIPIADLEEIKNLLVKIEGKLDLIKDGQAELLTLEPQCEHFLWLKTAIDECEKRPAAFTGKEGIFFTILAILGVIASIIFSFMDLPYASLGTGLLGILFFILAILQVRSRLVSKADYDEVQRIFDEYGAKFGRVPHSIASMKNTLEFLNPLFQRLNFIRDQINENKQSLSDLRRNLLFKLEILTGKKIGLQDPVGITDNLQKTRDQLVQQSEKLARELAATQVPPEEYISEPINIQYNPEDLKKFELQKQVIQQSLQEKEKKLVELKQNICFQTSDAISSDWGDLIDHLRDKREETSQAARKLKAEIGSGILITQVINGMRQREDESISQALASPLMREPIRAITHSYNGIELEGSEIIACSEHQRFPLDSLSTGAREQLLLALRIGIASHLLMERKMFLILDDAFQHSDWQRREWLVDEMADLANIGWQVIYFTMDDHIRQLFEQRIKPLFLDRYQAFELKS